VLMSPGVVAGRAHQRARRGIAASMCWVMWSCFARNVQAPVIGITGTNGKSTGHEPGGAHGRGGGTHGARRRQFGAKPAHRPAGAAHPDLYVLELSSFSAGDHVLTCGSRPRWC